MANLKWEYKLTQVEIHSPPIDLTKPKSVDAMEHFTQMGDEGWELINFIQQNMRFTCFWKREKKGSQKEWTS